MRTFLVSAIFAILRRYEPGLELRKSLALRPTDISLALIGVGLGVCLKLPAEASSAVVERFFPSQEGELLARAALYRTETIGQVLSLIAVLCVSAPLVEESFFRGATHSRLLARGQRTAAIVSGGRKQLDVEGMRQRGGGIGVGWIDPAMQRRPSERPVHDPGVEIQVAKPARQEFAQRALAGPGRPVDRDNLWNAHRVLFR